MSIKYKSVVLLTALSSTLYSQDTTKIDSVTVTEETQQSIQLESMLNSQPRDISEMLKNDVKLDIAGGSANAKRFYIRGVSEALTNITVDGAKQSKDLHQHRGGLTTIDTELLKSVDVDAGVAPADSGPGNLGGEVLSLKR